MPITPAQFAKDRGFSERAVRKKARELGACRILGRVMILEDEDVVAILEALRPCPLLSSAGQGRTSGTTAAPSALQTLDGDYAALLALRTKQMPKGSLPRRKRESGNVVSMDQRRF